MADSTWRFSVLGPVRGWGPDGELDLGSPQQRELLALLVMRAGRAATAEELIDALWGQGQSHGQGQSWGRGHGQGRSHGQGQGAPKGL
ncbi:hypothetical protein ACFQ9X_19615 [Catenulispora yoronensis]